MLQLTQNLRDGHMALLEVPAPAPGAGSVLVRNHFSVISAGTEGRTVADARKSLLAKARARKEDIDKVFRLARKQGWIKTYRTVMRRLEAPVPLGYSCAGEVIAVGPGVKKFRPGDRVACGGNSASHAEIVSVPENLCVSVPAIIPLEQAAFTTLASIAMQGIRQSGSETGGYVVVLGLGLIGLITVQLLRASGVRVIAIDMREEPLSLAERCGAALTLTTEDPGMLERVFQLSQGIGVDAVIITASAKDTKPVNLAGELCRKKGIVVIVGAVPTGFERKNYYRKELELRMSCSYGPGRYDPIYEEQGIDYPTAYVRWTENRNMQAFIDLVADGQVDPSLMISHVFPIENAAEAYQMILSREEAFTGILLKYKPSTEITKRIDFPSGKAPSKPVRTAVIGTGAYANNVMLPLLKGSTTLTGVVSVRGLSGHNAASRYGFQYASSDPREVLDDPDTNTLFILTRHHTHAKLTSQALSRGKHVFVEKPLAIDAAGLEDVRAAYETAPTGTILFTGYNRRFAPMTIQVCQALPVGVPRTISMRINAGKLPATHWIHDPLTGGGRIIGEVCHFVDLAIVLAESPVSLVYATVLGEANPLNDSLNIILQMNNGSTASITYVSNGHPDLPKEWIEVSAGGVSAQIRDFKRVEIWGKRHIMQKSRGQDKGHAAIVKTFFNTISLNQISPMPFAEQWNASATTIAILQSLRESKSIRPGEA